MPKEKKEKVLDKELEHLVLEMPWLQHLDATESFAKAATAAASRTAAMTAANDALEVDIDDDLVFAGLAAVEKGRCAEAAVAVDRGHSDFRVKENYGESNVRKGKALHDAVQCYCYTKEGEEWARDLPTQVTFKMTFTEHTEPACRIVARAWVHRMQYFFDYQRSDGSEGFKFTKAMVDTYSEPDELTRLAATCTKGSTLKRIALVRKVPLSL